MEDVLNIKKWMGQLTTAFNCYQRLGRPNHDLCLKRRLPPKTLLKEYILNMFDIKLTDSQGEFLTRNVETADQDASCT